MRQWLKFICWSLEMGSPCDREALLDIIVEKLESSPDDAWFIPSLECLADYLETGREVRLTQARDLLNKPAQELEPAELPLTTLPELSP